MKTNLSEPINMYEVKPADLLVTTPVSSEENQKAKELLHRLLSEQPLTFEGFASSQGSSLAGLQAQSPTARSEQIREEWNKAVEQLVALGVIQVSFSAAEKVSPHLKHLPIETLVDVIRRTAVVLSVEDGKRMDTALSQGQDFILRLGAAALFVGLAHTVMPAIFINTLAVKILLPFATGFITDKTMNMVSKDKPLPPVESGQLASG